jgi:hypothetical protein
MTVILFLAWFAGANAQTVTAKDDASRIVEIQNLNVTPSRVTGELVNKTPHFVRDIELLVQYHWLWNNEFKPGEESPGRAVFVKLDKEIAPGKSLPFEYTPPFALPPRNDGQFKPEVSIAGFTTVVPQGMAAR